MSKQLNDFILCLKLLKYYVSIQGGEQIQALLIFTVTYALGIGHCLILLTERGREGSKMTKYADVILERPFFFIKI